MPKTTSKTATPKSASSVRKEMPLKRQVGLDHGITVVDLPAPAVPANPPKKPRAAKPLISAEIKAYLKKNLSIQVERGDFVSPNDRKVKLMLEGECISSSTFCIRAQREYEG